MLPIASAHVAASVGGYGQAALHRAQKVFHRAPSPARPDFSRPTRGMARSGLHRLAHLGMQLARRHSL